MIGPKITSKNDTNRLKKLSIYTYVYTELLSLFSSILTDESLFKTASKVQEVANPSLQPSVSISQLSISQLFILI